MSCYKNSDTKLGPCQALVKIGIYEGSPTIASAKTIIINQLAKRGYAITESDLLEPTSENDAIKIEISDAYIQRYTDNLCINGVENPNCIGQYLVLRDGQIFMEEQVGC